MTSAELCWSLVQAPTQIPTSVVLIEQFKMLFLLVIFSNFVLRTRATTVSTIGFTLTNNFNTIISQWLTSIRIKQ